MADRCAVVVRANDVAQWGGNCSQPVACRARWRIHDHTASLLLCAEHVRELGDDERLTDVVRFYDASVET